MCGSFSGTCSTLLFQPLDLVKTRMQTLQSGKQPGWVLLVYWFPNVSPQLDLLGRKQRHCSALFSLIWLIWCFPISGRAESGWWRCSWVSCGQSGCWDCGRASPRYARLWKRFTVCTLRSHTVCLKMGSFCSPSPSAAVVFRPDHPRSGDLLQLLSLPEAALLPGQQARSHASCHAGRGRSDGRGGRDAADYRHQDTFWGEQMFKLRL